MTRLLVVDDEVLIREVLATVLGDEGYAVTTASDGRHALALITADPPDLLISDVTMPHMDGRELLTQVREQFPTLPVILMSALTPWKPQRDLPAHTEFLAKPFDLGVLLACIARLTTPDGA